MYLHLFFKIILSMGISVLYQKLCSDIRVHTEIGFLY